MTGTVHVQKPALKNNAVRATTAAFRTAPTGLVECVWRLDVAISDKQEQHTTWIENNCVDVMRTSADDCVGQQKMRTKRPRRTLQSSSQGALFIFHVQCAFSA